MPAKIFGLYPRKGIISENADADIVIWNPDIKREISAKNHHQRCDHNIYEGLMTQGRPEFVIKSGNVVVSDGNIITEP
jgi:dihydropyrimidinase